MTSISDISAAASAPDAKIAALQTGVQISTLLQGMAQRRKIYTDNIDAQRMTNGRVEGFAEIDGSGEAEVDVMFPISLADKPNFGCGLELAPNNWASDGAFPLWSATVFSWYTKRSTNASAFYVGAKIGVVVIGVRDMKSILHYSFSSLAFTNPDGTDTSVTSSL
jgi:hypothetical protein